MERAEEAEAADLRKLEEFSRPLLEGLDGQIACTIFLKKAQPGLFISSPFVRVAGGSDCKEAIKINGVRRTLATVDALLPAQSSAALAPFISVQPGQVQS